MKPFLCEKNKIVLLIFNTPVAKLLFCKTSDGTSSLLVAAVVTCSTSECGMVSGKEAKARWRGGHFL